MTSNEQPKPEFRPPTAKPTKLPPLAPTPAKRADFDGAEAQKLTAASADGSASSQSEESPVSRRRFVQGLLIGGGVAAAGSGLFLRNRSSEQPVSPGNANAPKRTQKEVAGQGAGAAPADQRVLVLIELEGGNDGLSTVIPRNLGTYYDARPDMSFGEEELMPFDDEVGLNPELVQLSKRNLTLVEGVGPINGDLSHFEMVRRWEQGDISGAGDQRAGFLARLVDSLPGGSVMTGLSVSGHTPRFNSVEGSVLSLQGPHQLNVLTNDDWIYPDYRNALKMFGGGPMTTEMANSWNSLFAIGESLDLEVESYDEEEPMIAKGRELGRNLKTAATMIAADVGVRVVHVRMGGFDTHEGHDYKHMDLMAKIDISVAGFLDDIEAAGMSDRVLVATSSEFGRRVEENNGGFDHGAASTMLMKGPIKPGRLGEPSPLDSLDDDGNLKTTIGFDRYLATLAQSWLGVEAASVLPNNPKPLDLF